MITAPRSKTFIISLLLIMGLITTAGLITFSFTPSSFALHLPASELPPGGQHLPAPTLPPNAGTITDSKINIMMGMVENVTGYVPPSDKIYEDALGFKSMFATVTCSNGIESDVSMDSRREAQRPPHVWHHDKGHDSSDSNYVAHMGMGNLRLDIMYLDIYNSTYHVSGIAEVRSGFPCYTLDDIEPLVTFDLFGLCDGSEAHLTARGYDWSVKFDDTDHSATCLINMHH